MGPHHCLVTFSKVFLVEARTRRVMHDEARSLWLQVQSHLLTAEIFMRISKLPVDLGLARAFYLRYQWEEALRL